MESNLAIHVEGLGKKYRLQPVGASGYQTLRNALAHRFCSMFGSQSASATGIAEMHKGHGDQTADFWALKDLSFDVARGDVFGIIGRNGAGKSTLLKLLSRVTAPTTGRIEIMGRMSSLLEVGTGFHPELTGRENVFVNGAILGMTRAEIKRRFDEIVEFADIAEFIDTPVKRYSSGMYVRLAFSVAAHLDPDILMIDEILSVGDARFQKKCLGKMDEISRTRDKTILFISHNMGMITSLCNKAMLIERGRIAECGPAASVVKKYFSSETLSSSNVNFTRGSQPPGDHLATLLHASVEDGDGAIVDHVDIRSPFRIRMTYRIHASVPRAPFPNFHFYISSGQLAFASSGYADEAKEAGVYEAICNIPGWLLNNDTYFVDLALTFTHSGIHVSFNAKSSLAFVVVDPIDETLDVSRGGYAGDIPGVVRPRLEWCIHAVSGPS